MKALVAFVLICSAVVVGMADESGPVGATAPANKRLYVVTDSVGLGAERAIPPAFPGWEVILDGDAGEFTETMARRYVAPRAASGQLGDYAVVATGYNYPYWDPDRFDRSIDEMIATLAAGGVRHVFWVTLREVKPEFITAAAWRQVQPYYWYFPAVNDHLERALDRHPNLTLIDWAAVADQPGLTYDAIHLNPTGAALYASIMRQGVIDATTAAPGGSVTRVIVPDQFPPAQAVALNLTTVSPRAPGFLTAYACDQPQPPSSNHNYGRGETVAHSVIVKLGATSEVCVFTRTATNLVVDITGYFGAGMPALAGTSERVVDTRLEGAPLTPAIDRPVQFSGVGAIDVVTVTAVDAAQPGFVRLAPCGSTTTTSTVNVTGPAAVPNMAIVDRSRPTCVSASMQTHVLIDRFVSFASEAVVDLGEPRRVLDTRAGGGPAPAAGTTLTLDAGALGTDQLTTGVILNLTVTDAVSPGFLAVSPCADVATATSAVNYRPGQVIANLAVVEPNEAGDVCITTLASAHVIADLLGTTEDDFTGGVPQRQLDTRTANLPLNWP